MSIALKTNYQMKLFHFSSINFKSYLTDTGTLKALIGANKFTNNAVMNSSQTIFQGTEDRFRGITVDSVKEYSSEGSFEERLQKSLDFWVENNKRCIWFKVQTEHSMWIPFLTKNGFDFHHANPGYVTLYKWLPIDEPVNLPQYAHTMMGVGGLVVNEKNEILVVSEKYPLVAGSWKLPGGYVENKENLIDAAIREVEEETGVKCEFDTLVSLRHSHSGSYGCSDVYTVIALKPLNQDLQKCEREIAKVEWMPVNEYLNHPNVHEGNRQLLLTFLKYKSEGISIAFEKCTHPVLKREYCLYYAKCENGEKR